MRVSSDYENALLQGRLWTPRELRGRGLAGSYDVSDLSTLTLASGPVVAQIADKSGNGRDLAQSTARPTFSPQGFLGRPCILFDQFSNGLFYASTGFLAANTIINAFFVGTIGNATDNSRVLSINPTGSTDFTAGYIPILQQGGLGVMTAFKGAAPWGSAAPFTYDAPMVYASVFETTTSHRSYLNGVAASAVSGWANFCTNIDRWSIGQREGGASDNMTGKFCELVVVTGLMAYADIIRVHSYQAYKWGLATQMAISALPPTIGN